MLYSIFKPYFMPPATSAGSFIILTLPGAYALVLPYSTRSSAGLYVRRAAGSQLVKQDTSLGYLIVPTRMVCSISGLSLCVFFCLPRRLGLLSGVGRGRIGAWRIVNWWHFLSSFWLVFWAASNRGEIPTCERRLSLSFNLSGGRLFRVPSVVWLRRRTLRYA